MVIKIVPNDKGNPPGKLAEAELHFTDGELAGLKLHGLRRLGAPQRPGRNVTFPARNYVVNGERRSFALAAAAGRPPHAQDHSARSHPAGLRGVAAQVAVAS